MIELDDFIAGAMTAIVRGIKKGQESPDVGGYIAPLIQGEKRNDHGNFHLKDDPSNQATIVQFDVQVATKSQHQGEGTGKGKVRLYVVDVELGGGGKITTESSNTHRLQFAIPLRIPVRGERIGDGTQAA